MKKIICNISDSVYEKLRFEALRDRKSIQEVIQDRIICKPFDSEIEKSLDHLIEMQYQNME
jgi:hypothetical protein